MIRIISLVTIVISMLSCTSATKNLSVSEILPRKGYVYIKKIVNLRRCTETACQTGSIAAAGSGFVLKVTHKGSFIMTAAHVCATNTAELLPGVQAIDHLKVQTLEGRYYNAKVLQV